MAPHTSSTRLIESRLTSLSETLVGGLDMEASENITLLIDAIIFFQNNISPGMLFHPPKESSSQPCSEPLRRHPLGWGTDNFPCSSNCSKLPQDCRACSSICKIGTSICDKSRTKRTPIFPKAPILLHVGSILHKGDNPSAKQRLPTSHAKPCPIRPQG